MRLNKEIRQKIVDNAYKASPIPAAKKELTRRSMELSEKVRIASFGEHGDLTDKIKALEAEFKALVTRRGIPEGYKVKTAIRSRESGLYATLGEQEFVFLRFDGGISSRRSNAPYVVSGQIDNKIVGHKQGELTFDANHEFTQEYRSICDTSLDLKSQEEVLRNTVIGALSGFNTVEKLLEEWPEAKDLIPKEVEAAAKPMPLALQTDELNKLIGLPK